MLRAGDRQSSRSWRNRNLWPRLRPSRLCPCWKPPLGKETERPPGHGRAAQVQSSSVLGLELARSINVRRRMGSLGASADKLRGQLTQIATIKADVVVLRF